MLAIFRLRTKASVTPTSKFGKHPVSMMLPSLILLLLGYGLAVVGPEQSGVNLAAIRIFYPDIGGMITLAASSAAVWAAVRTVLLFRGRPKSGSIK